MLKRFSEVLTAHKVVQLRQLAIQSGILSSGNKSQLVQRLAHHFESEPEDTCASVLSFDLGYRNFAFCHINKDAEIVDWALVDFDLPSFHPSVTAPVIRQFIKDRIQDHLKVADKVLIEQQRARSNGSISILEPILRVNSIEAILWGGLYEATERINRPQLTMKPVLGQAVNSLWQPELDQVIANNPERFNKIKEGYYHKKQVSTLLVQYWLDTNTVIKSIA
ncbi:uncharacterized protein EV154DRAFT_557900 [Mucor mucedo]|uniref:uncharacterized protein n=1 Tax=Mucor mucedo TaxID=29922 RepID=UPI00221EA99E|nr:uncharacterized protein EV154DRAFT_557900 [Mucor mucedo]KAI7897110.1 hypothetical protein EV154DRAFT_557900 [Mucor mucedo]